MSNEKTDWWVGLFVLLGAIALTFLALRAGNLSSFSFAPT
jgi:phospholipid/cholesterol/gamma-HCH transport system substrate-binding protein